MLSFLLTTLKPVLHQPSVSQVANFVAESSTVKPLLSGHLRDLPKCRLIEGVRLIEVCKSCAMFVNDQHSTVTLYCDKVARGQVHYLSLPPLICL